MLRSTDEIRYSIRNKAYNNRSERQRFVSSFFLRPTEGQIVDVGCWNNELRKLVGQNCIGVDKAGKPDLFIDLEYGLPFKDCSFECVVCLDVLEHIERVHLLFDELLRVSKDYVIVSLPNNWASVLCALLRVLTGRGIDNRRQFLKQYGLPPFAPKDRHIWFFNYTEAKNFVLTKIQGKGWKPLIVEPCISRKIRTFVLPIFRLLFWIRYEDFLARTIWIILKKDR